MGAERGAANIARYNEERSAHILTSLAHELQLCKKRKLEFRTVGLLAAYMGEKLNTHRTTLLRNPKYKCLLLDHLAGQPGVVARTPDSTTDPAVLQAKLVAAKIEASNARQLLAHTKAQLERLQSSGTMSTTGNDSQVAFADLAMVMVSLLHRFPDFIQLNKQRREIIDLSAKPSDRLVAGKERLSAFITWLEVNQALPLVHALVLDDTPNCTGL